VGAGGGGGRRGGGGERGRGGREGVGGARERGRGENGGKWGVRRSVDAEVNVRARVRVLATSRYSIKQRTNSNKQYILTTASETKWDIEGYRLYKSRVRCFQSRTRP